MGVELDKIIRQTHEPEDYNVFCNDNGVIVPKYKPIKPMIGEDVYDCGELVK